MPRRDLRLYLADIIDASDAIASSVTDRSLDEYRTTRSLRRSLERELSIVGEAVTQVLKQDPSLESAITDAWAIVRFRNLLVHSYHLMEPATVWDILVNKVPTLRREAAEIMQQRFQS